MQAATAATSRLDISRSFSSKPPSGLRKRECDVGVARFGAELPTARRSHHVLFAADRVSTRRRVAGGGQSCLPQHFAGRLVERAKLLVHRRGDENQTTGGNDRPTVLLRAGDGNALRRQSGVLAEGNTPEVGAGVEIDGAEGSPRRFYRRVSARITPPLVADEVV